MSSPHYGRVDKLANYGPILSFSRIQKQMGTFQYMGQLHEKIGDRFDDHPFESINKMGKESLCYA